MSERDDPEEDFVDTALDAALGFSFLVDGTSEPGLGDPEEVEE